MEKNDYLTISRQLEPDFISFCKLNDIQDIETFRFECFKKGYYIEKYGLLGEDDEIKPWEIVVEKEVIKEVEVENIFQKEQEIQEIETKFSTKMEEMENIFRKERIELLTKIQELEDSKKLVIESKSKDCEDKLNMITLTVQNLKEDLTKKENKIKEQENKINDLSGIIQSRLARFHPGSNLKDKL